MPASDGSGECESDHEHAYPPSEWSVAEVTAALADSRERDPRPPIPTYEDAPIWASLRADDALAPVIERVRTEAATYAAGPVPRVSARQFERVATEGRKSRAYYETLSRQRRAPTVLALTECLDRNGTYIDPLVEHVWALCEATSWLNPRQVGPEGRIGNLPRPVRDVLPEARVLTHYTAWIAHELAEVDHLLGDRLPAGVRERLRAEIDVRAFEPYEAREDWWRTAASNWNAVCNGRIAVAALYCEPDTERLGRIVTAAAHSLRYYLECFDSDGCTPEGVMYWDYGMRYYVEFAAQLAARTGGRYSLLTPPVLREIARFPHRVGFAPGSYPAFGDSLEAYAPRPSTFFHLGERFDMPALSAHGWAVLTATEPGGDLHDLPPWDVPSLVWSRLVGGGVRADENGDRGPNANPRAKRYAPPKATLSSGAQWWVARTDPLDPAALVVAAKGGHNDEPHNHNDCGSVLVHAGGESLLTDLGAPSYSREYGGDERYEHLAARSLGHAVPYVNGCEQAAGREHAARLVDSNSGSDRESITFDLAACYPDGARVDALCRTVNLDRVSETVTIADEAVFVEGERTDLESVFVSYSPIEATGTGFLVRGVGNELRIETGGGISKVERLPAAVDMSYRDGFEAERPDVWRVRVIAPTPESGASTDGRERRAVRIDARSRRTV